MNKAPKEKDFGKSEPQVSSVYHHQPPPALPHFDHSKGGKNVKPVVITDEHFDSDFVPPEIPDLNFAKKGRR